MWGRGPRGNSGACSSLFQILVTSLATHKQIGPFWCWFLSGWACAHSRPLWVSSTNSPVRLGVSPAAASTPTGVSSQRFEALFPSVGTLGCAVFHRVHQLLSCRESSLPSCPSSPLLPVWMNVSFLSFLVVGFPYSSIFCQFWLFFVFKLSLSFFWLCEEAQHVCLYLHLGRKSLKILL